MSGLYKFVIFIAALSLIASSARMLWLSFDTRTHLERAGLIAPSDASVRLGEGAQDQFLTAQPDAAQAVSLWSRDPETGEASREDYTAAPIFYQDAGTVLPGDRIASLSRSIYRGRPTNGERAGGLPARACPARYAGNVLVYDHQTGETRLVFDEAARAITEKRVVANNDSGTVHILIEYAAADSDNDGQLTCNDKRSLALYEATVGALHEIDLNGGEPVLRERWYRDDFPLIGVGVDENGDGYHDYTRERVRLANVDLETMTLNYLMP